jgi:flagellum-specific ATP synthase
MATYGDMEELIRLGAYRRGSSPEVDRAIEINPALEAFLNQRKDESTLLHEGYDALAKILETSDSSFSNRSGV